MINKKTISILILLYFITILPVFGAYHIQDINRFINIHYFNNQLQENLSYWGIFKNFHFFMNNKSNKVNLYDYTSMNLKNKYKISIDKDRITSLGNIRNVTFLKNKVWFLDQRNRISLFEYTKEGFKFVGLFYLTGIEVVYNIKVTPKGLFAFGKNYKNKFKIISYTMMGSQKKVVRNFGETIKGNILLSRDNAGNILYGFTHSSKIRYFNKKDKTYHLSNEISYIRKKDYEKKNGILYNIAIINNFLIASYWTVDGGGLLEVYNRNTKELAVTASYPIGEGKVYKEGIYVYRTSFQDNKLRSFIMELDMSKILDYLKNK